MDKTKIAEGMHEYSSLSHEEIKRFLSLIKTDADEDAVRKLYTGWSTSAERRKMYLRLDARVTKWLKAGRISDLADVNTRIPIPGDMFTASLGADPLKWKSWFMSNGFKVDPHTNLLSKDGFLWKVNQDTKELEPVAKPIVRVKPYPDFNLIRGLRAKYMSHSVKGLTADETCDLINHMWEALSQHKLI